MEAKNLKKMDVGGLSGICFCKRTPVRALGSSVDLYLPFRSFCQGGAAAQRQENQEKEDVSQAKYSKSLLQ